jgi:hypothetical protein
MLPQDPAWNEWLNRTGELPPDFDALPTIMDLPDPLLLEENGKQVRISTKERWERRRLFLKKQFEYYVTGRFPPPPGNAEASIVDETKDGELTIRDVLLTFGPERKAKLRVQPKSSIATLWACVWLARTHLGWSSMPAGRCCASPEFQISLQLNTRCWAGMCGTLSRQQDNSGRRTWPWNAIRECSKTSSASGAPRAAPAWGGSKTLMETR